jgi:secondary thiamine-phosphate synthase enzyme
MSHVVTTEELIVVTPGRRARRACFVDVTEQVAEVVRRSHVVRGLCSVFIEHTSASLVVQENADPRVLEDLARWMDDRVPEGPLYDHDDEGPDDMPAHIKAAITKTSETLPVDDGRLCLGTWQALYVWEHRNASHRRRLRITVLGETR